jgi:flagellar biosynthesis chaperone FliJ
VSENVVIRISVDANTKSIDRVIAQLTELRLAATALDKKMGGLSDELDDTDKEMNKVSKSTDKSTKSMGQMNKQTTKLEKTMKKAKKEISSFDKFLQGFGKAMQSVIKFGLKAMLVNVAGLSAALLSVSGAFTIARLAVKAWHATLTVGAAAGATMISVLAGLAAGQRQYAAAISASSYGGRSSGLVAANTQLRGLQKNASLAVLGADAINGAFAALSSNTRLTGGLQAALQQLGNYAASSADPKKSFTGAGEFLGLLQKNGKLTPEALKAAEDIGPQFVEALNKSIKKGHTSSKSLLKDIMSGELTTGVAGQLDTVNTTLFGTFKRQLGLLTAQFADLGQSFLPGFTATIERLGQVMSTGLIAITGNVSKFANGSLINTLVTGFEKIVTSGTHLFNEYLPKSQGMLKTLSQWGSNIKNAFKAVHDELKPMLDGAGALKDAFGPLVKSFFTEFYGGMKAFNAILIENAPALNAFGTSLKNLFMSFSNLSGEVKVALVQLLPIFTEVANVFKDVVNAIGDVAHALNGMGRGGSLLALAGGIAGYVGLGQLGKARGGTGQGSLLSKVGQATGLTKGAGSMATAMMNVTAQVVNLTGLTMGGAVGSPWGPPTGKSSPGPGMAGPPVPASVLADVEATASRFSSIGSKIQSANRKIGQNGAVRMVGTMVAMYGVDKMLRSKNESSAVKGGAIAGAGIGVFAGPEGALIGAGVGAGVGWGYNAVYGQAKNNKEFSKNLAAQKVQTTGSGISDLLAQGDYIGARNLLNSSSAKNAADIKTIKGSGLIGATDTLRKRMAKDMFSAGTITQEQMDILIKAPGTYVTQLEDQEEALKKDVNPTIQRLTDNMQTLSKATGMSEKQVQEFANTIGTDLTSKLTDISDFISKTLGGLDGVASSKEDLNNRMQDVYLKALDNATLPSIDKQTAMAAIDQSGTTLLEKAYGGADTKGDYASYIRDAVSYEVVNATDSRTGAVDYMKVNDALNKKIGQNGLIYQPGAIFAGQEDRIGGGFQGMLGDVTSNFNNAYATEAMKKILNDVHNKTGQTFDMTQIQGLSGMTPAELTKLSSLATNPSLLKDTSGAPKNAAAASVDLQALLSGTGITIDPTASQTLIDAFTTGSQTVSSDFIAASSIAGSNIANAISTVPINIGGLSGWSLPNGTVTGSVNGNKVNRNGTTDQRSGANDTASPRFNATMANHNAINGSLAGKRNITSGMRDYNLGSGNSDHLTGGALDIQGQGLGAYANKVKAGGGFAEFHGDGFDRHLHVVPGTGDTASPFQGAGSSGSASGGVVVHVHPSPGMDENALARKVVSVIRKEDRSVAERMN